MRKFSQVTTAPASEPLTTAEAKDYLRVDTSADDTLIDMMVAAARVTVERMVSIQIMDATRTLYLDSWPACISLDHPPVSAIDSVKYYDEDNNLQTLSSAYYTLDANRAIPVVELNYGYEWPTVYLRHNAIEIAYSCGYASASAVPDAIKIAILMLVKDMYDNRGSFVINEPFQTSIGIYDVVANYLSTIYV